MIKNILLLALLFPFGNWAQDIIWQENFDAGVLPEGWMIIDNDNNSVHPTVSQFAPAWIVTEDIDDEDNFVVGSTSYFQPVDRANRWLITPGIQLGATGNVFSWFAKSHDPSFPDSYRVMVSPSGETELADFTDTLGIFSNETPFGISRSFSLNKYDGDIIRIAFINTTFNGYLLYLDSMEVRENDPLSTEELEINPLVIFPNPATNLINIQLPQFKSAQVYSIQGRLLRYSEEDQIDIASLPSGIYLVHVQDTFGRFYKRKLVKK